jgi:hypothetical protein
MPITLNGDGAISGLTATGISAVQTVSASNITTGTLPFAQLPTGSVLQVVSTALTTYLTVTPGSNYVWADITGLSLSITPKFSTSKIMLVAYVVTSGFNGYGTPTLAFNRDGTRIALGTSSVTGQAVTSVTYGENSIAGIAAVPLNFLDSPATTSAVTYKIQTSGDGGGGTIYINRREADTRFCSISTITAMEIAA